jgi:diguanylate cyclase (GGDEF)-like protein
MHISPASEAFANATPIDAIEIDPQEIERALLKQLLENYRTAQRPVLVPMLMLIFSAFYIEKTGLMLSLLAAQGFIQLELAFYTRKLLRAMERGEAEARPMGMRLLCVWLSGLGWGLMMLPIVQTLNWGIAPMFVCIILVITNGLSAVMTSTVPKFLYAALGGFVGAMLPQTIYLYDLLGPVPLIAVLGLGPALVWLSSGIARQARKSMRNQLQNEVLARQLKTALETAEYFSSHDSLTGLPNRRAFERAAMATRAGTVGQVAASIVLLDLDHFKAINDTYGHRIGDAALRETARLLATHIGQRVAKGEIEALTARWGGEEFILLLNDVRADQAVPIAESLRLALAGCRDAVWPEGMRLTGSLGVADWEMAEPLHEAIGRADEAMYQAKQLGRDRVEVSGQLPQRA